MEIKLRRTECEKFDDDIDNCPFQESAELNNVRHTADPSGHAAEDAAWDRWGNGADDSGIPSNTDE